MTGCTGSARTALLAGVLASSLLASPASARPSGSGDPPESPQGLPTELVADLSLAPARHLEESYSVPRSASLDGVAYFFVDDGIHGTELWRSDGTALGTRLLRDVCPGRCGVDIAFDWSALAAVGGTIYFGADDGVHGAELWASDGTALGTHLVRDIRPGLGGSWPSYYFAIGDLLYFSADDGEHGIELWRSDGTPGGTELVADLDPGPAGGLVTHLYDGPGFLYAVRAEGSRGLWRIDGTPGGTYRLLEATFNGSNVLKWPSFATLPDGRLIFSASDPDHGEEPWISDGTLAGTELLRDLEPGLEDSIPGGFVRFGGEVLFHALATARAGDEYGLWTTAGDVATTVEIPLPAGSAPNYGPFYGVDGARFFFTLDQPSTGRELWLLDGLGVQPVLDLLPGPGSGLPGISGFGYFDLPVHAIPGGVVFAGFDADHGLEIWESDGTEAGTVRLTELAPGVAPTLLITYSAVAGWPTAGGRILFQDWTAADGYRLHRTDGTLAGTVTLGSLDDQSSSLHPAQPNGFYSIRGPDCRAPAGDHLLFAADLDPWLSDLRLFSVDASSLAVEELPTLGPFFPSFGCTSLGSRALFFSHDAATGALRATDGTAAGTEDLYTRPIDPSGYWGASRRSPFLRHGGSWIGFAGDDWIVTDGTSAGTSVEPAPVAGSEWFASVGEVLLLGAGGLYASDGTAASVAPVREPGTDEPWYAPEDFARLGDRLLFTAEHGGLGRELWSTDGTPEGTILLGDVRLGAEGSSSRSFLDPLDGEPEPHVVALDARAVYAADDGVHGLELWGTDGTPQGTALLLDLYPGAYPSSPQELWRVGDRIYFVAEHPLYGRELFATDGTVEGTYLVRDLVPGEGSSVPQALTAYKDLLLFSAWTPQFGREAWRSDGTPEGTVRITDLAPGPASSSPDRFAVVGDRLFFAATDQIHGFELFTLVDPTLAEIFRDSFETGDTSRWTPVP